MRWQKATAALVLLCTLATAGTAASAAAENQESEWTSAAGVTPDSVWYGLDRAAEGLQLALTSKVETRAGLQSALAVERASEAVVMTDRGKAELAARAAAESSRSLTDAAAHLQVVMGGENPADSAGLQIALETAHKRSLTALNRVLAKAPPTAQTALKQALANQEKAFAALGQFQDAHKAFQAMNGELQSASRALAEARRKGDPAAVLEAEIKVRALEGRKSELEELKDRAEKTKAEVEERLDAATESLKKAEVELTGEQSEKKPSGKGKDSERQDPPQKPEQTTPREKESPRALPGGKGPRN